MGYSEANDPALMRSYEGLVIATARLIVREADVQGVPIEIDVEDIEQRLRLKVWRALGYYDPAKCRTNQRRYVFMCVTDEKKDILRMRRRGDVLIDDLAPAAVDVVGGSHFKSEDWLEQKLGLVEHQEAVYGMVDNQQSGLTELVPGEEGVVIPSTLTDLEVEVVRLLFCDFKQSEAARHLGLEKRQIDKLVQSIRTKMADWRPSIDAAAPASVPAAA